MNKKLILIISILSIPCIAENWTAQESGVMENLYSVFFNDSHVGWSCGAYGTLLETKDGGKKWYKKDLPTYNDLKSINFCDSTNGWIVGDSSIIFSTDNGGKTWKKIVTDLPLLNLNAVYVISPDVIWISSREIDTINGCLINTKDGGKTWKYAKVPDFTVNIISECTNVNVISVYFKDSKPTLIGTEFLKYQMGDTELSSVIFKVKNEGTEFECIGSTLDAGSYLVSAKNTIFFAVGYSYDYFYSSYYLYETIIKSEDGVNWDKCYTNITNPDLSSYTPLYATFSTETQGKILYKEKVLYTKDQGKTWNSKLLPRNKRFTSVFFISKDKGWIAGLEGVIYYTSNNCGIDNPVYLKENKEKHIALKNAVKTISQSKNTKMHFILLEFYQDNLPPPTNIGIYTYSGRKMRSIIHIFEEGKNLILSTKPLPRGSYILKIMVNKEYSLFKLVVMK